MKVSHNAIAACLLVATMNIVSTDVSFAQLGQPGKVNPALVKLDQLRDSPVPLDANFFDESGKPVKLGDYFKGKPVILNLIFYKCPGTCLTELAGMVKLFRDPVMTFNAGTDFEVVTISINPKEGPSHAEEKHRQYTTMVDRKGIDQGWHFLVGADEQIKRVAGAIGFKYAYNPQTDQFAHPTGIILVTPEGRTSKYFYGQSYPARDVRLALIEASNNKIGTLSDVILLNCIYQYDPKSGKYGLAIIRLLQVACGLTVLIIGTSIVLMSRGKQPTVVKALTEDVNSTEDIP